MEEELNILLQNWKDRLNSEQSPDYKIALSECVFELEPVLLNNINHAK